MSAYEMQILATERKYDLLMEELENSEIEILHSFIPGSNVHNVINNPVTEGIDEG